jgi:hypothetical protein
MFASYTSHFTKSAHSFNLAFQDGNIFNDGHASSTNRPSGRQNNQQNDDNDDTNDRDENDDDDENDIKRKKKIKKSASSSRAAHKPSHQEIYDKFLLAENALKKFEQNFNHHSQVHVDMVTVEFLSLSLSFSQEKKRMDR